MPWKKLGKLFAPNKEYPWLQTHASLPVAHHLEGSMYHIYFSSRDEAGHSHIGYLTFDLATQKVLDVHPQPILSPGPKGAFDERGVSLGHVLEIGAALYCYYVGWGEPVNGHFHNSIGLAVMQRGGTQLEKVGEVLALDKNDPLNLTYPFVHQTDQGFVMYYGSNLRWGKQESDMQHVIKRAVSKDGLHWVRNQHTLIDLAHPGEFAVLRPSVLVEDGSFKMWYSYKGAHYRIGYAESPDGENWQRKDDQVGIAPSGQGWDSEEVAYPFIFQHNGQKYMLYNGNGYGLTGFGLAVWE